MRSKEESWNVTINSDYCPYVVNMTSEEEVFEACSESTDELGRHLLCSEENCPYKE